MNLIRQGATSYLVTVSCPCSLQPSGVVLWPCLWSCSYIYTFHFYEFLAEPRPSLHWELGLTAIIVFSFLAVRSHAHLHFVLFPFKTQCCLEDAMGHSANISVKYKQMYLQVSISDVWYPTRSRGSGWKAMLYSSGQFNEQTAFTGVLRLFVSPTAQWSNAFTKRVQ